MNPPRLAVSDKVVLHPYSMPLVAAMPRLKRGRVYCVEKVAEHHGAQFVALVGVEFRRLTADYRRRDPEGAVVLYHADTFQRVEVATKPSQPKEGH